MKANFYIIICILMIAMVLLTPLVTHSEEASPNQPWETPTNTTAGTSNEAAGYDKIEAVIKTSGSTTKDGKQVSSQGSEKDQQFVNDFLTQAANAITQAAGGSGWATSWTKTWKIGPDGKTYEVIETRSEGTVNGVAKPGNAQVPTAAQPAAPVQTTVTPTQPAAVAANAPAAGGPQTTQSASIPKQEAPQQTANSNLAPQRTQSTVTTNVPESKPQAQGIEIAPVRLPQPPVTLSIFDPVSQEESKFTAALNPRGTAKPPLTASISKPIYEDTRVKIALDVGPGIDRKDLNVTINDNEGEHNFDGGVFPENYRHIFRVPNQTDYKAKVVYNHPLSHERQEIINVQIPVLKMGFKNRTVEDSSKRSSIESSVGDTAKEEAAWGIQRKASTNNNSGNVRYAAANDSSVDMSDFYTDPAFSSGLESNGTQIADSGHAGISLKAGKSKIAADSDITAVNALSNETNGIQNETSENAYNSLESEEESQNTPSDEESVESPEEQTDEQKSAADGAYENPTGADQSSDSSSRSRTAQRDSNNISELSGASAKTSILSTQADQTLQDHDKKRMPLAADTPNKGHEKSNKISEGVATAEVKVQEKPYIVSISIRNKLNNKAQSFDFMNDPQPTAEAVTQQTPLAFSLDYAAEVQKDSIGIEIYDGKDVIKLTPNEMSGDFIEHVFAVPTQEAYIWVYGRTAQEPFSYKVIIPVKAAL